MVTGYGPEDVQPCPCCGTPSVGHHPPTAAGKGALPAKNRAKRFCPRGHPYDAENTYVSPQGKRSCRACKRIRSGRRGRQEPPPGPGEQTTR